MSSVYVKITKYGTIFIYAHYITKDYTIITVVYFIEDDVFSERSNVSLEFFLS